MSNNLNDTDVITVRCKSTEKKYHFQIIQYWKQKLAKFKRQIKFKLNLINFIRKIQ